MPPKRPNAAGTGSSPGGPVPAEGPGGPVRDAGFAPGPAPLPEADPEMDAAMAPFLEAAAADRSLDHFRTLFAGRPDAFARQWADREANRQGYQPVRRPLAEADLRGHLDGTATLGIYLLDAESHVRAAVLDADLVPALRAGKRSRKAAGTIRAELRFLARRVRSLGRERGVSPVIEFSGGKGYHFWFLFSRPVPAAAARRLLTGLAGAVSADLSAFSLEVFPKQDRLSGKGLGNLVKLPLGVHRMSGRRSWFSECADRSVDAQLCWLADVRPADPDRIDFGGPEPGGGGSGPAGNTPRRPGNPGKGRPNRTTGPRAVPLSPAPYPPPEAEEDGAGEPESDRQGRGADGPTSRSGAGAEPSAAAGGAADGSGAAALARLEAACPPLAAAAGECRSGRGLSESGERVLFQTLAFLPAGAELLHRLMAAVPDVPPREVEYRLGRVRGTPLGCRRIHAMTGYRGDFCDFSATEGYAHPLRHLEIAAPRPVHERTAELASALRNLKAAIAAVEGLLS